MQQLPRDCIEQPFEAKNGAPVSHKPLERRCLLDQFDATREALPDSHTFARMITRDPQMLEVFALIRVLALSDVTVVVTGESGTGKELVARAIHSQGKRNAGPFVPINCAALPETLFESELFGYERGAFTGAVQDRVGKIELAKGGTLFLDEVESIPLPMQAKLLRVLEERAIERLGSNRRINVDMRVVAATKQDLAAAVRAGQVRHDFYYRLNVLPVHLPPLRKRLPDVPPLVAHFLDNHSLAREKGVRGMTDTALRQLMTHKWPGNVRELFNVVERAVVRARGGTIHEFDLPEAKADGLDRPDNLQCRQSLRQFLEEAERRYLTQVLEFYRGSIAPAARHAIIDEATLHRKIRKHGLRPRQLRTART